MAGQQGEVGAEDLFGVQILMLQLRVGRGEGFCLDDSLRIVGSTSVQKQDETCLVLDGATWQGPFQLFLLLPFCIFLLKQSTPEDAASNLSVHLPLDFGLQQVTWRVRFLLTFLKRSSFVFHRKMSLPTSHSS